MRRAELHHGGTGWETRARVPSMHLTATLGLAFAACAPAERPVQVPELRLVVSERWNGGTRLVLVDEHGDRWAILGAGRGDPPTRDEQAAVSPDGRWVAFVSSRGRDLARTSLWVMPAAVGATAVRVTDGTGDDVDPCWTPAGDAVVFARRTGARFALARVAIGGGADQRAIGPVEVLAAGAVLVWLGASGACFFSGGEKPKKITRLTSRMPIPLTRPIIIALWRFSCVVRSKTTRAASSWGASDVKLLYSFMGAPVGTVVRSAGAVNARGRLLK